MQEVNCDVLVVGAGPAGCSAAKKAAEAGAHTLVIDKKKEIGVPVQCAEAIGEYLFPYLPYRVPEEQLIWKIDGMLFWADDITIERSGGIWSGFAINRANFDRWLATIAVKAGAHLFLESELIDVELSDGSQVTKAIVKTKEGAKEIKPQVVIGADGVHSKILSKLGFTSIEDKCVEVLSFELNNVELHEPRYEQIYLGDFSPGAYGYIFPLSHNRANVGVGTLFRTRKLEECYEEFLELTMVKRQLRTSRKVIAKSGWAPIQYLADKWNYGNVVLTGDAANQNFKPFVEGVLPGMICGDIAGKTASDFVFGKDALDNYPNHVMDNLGPFFLESDLFLDVLYELSKSSDKKNHLLRLGISTAIFSPQEIERLRKKDYASIRTIFGSEEIE